MSRIEIRDLPSDAKVSAREMARVLGGGATPIPPVPVLDVAIDPQRAGLVAIEGNPLGPIVVDHPEPSPVF